MAPGPDLILRMGHVDTSPPSRFGERIRLRKNREAQGGIDPCAHLSGL